MFVGFTSWVGLSREGYSGIKEVKFSMGYMLAVDNGAGAEKVYNLEEELQGEWVKCVPQP